MNNKRSVMGRKITKWKSQSPIQLDEELRSLDNEIKQLFRQVNEIKKERNRVITIIKEKRLGGNQFALLATCNEPPDDDDDDSWDIGAWEKKDLEEESNNYRRLGTWGENETSYSEPDSDDEDDDSVESLIDRYNSDDEDDDSVESLIDRYNEQPTLPPPTQHQYQRPPPPPQYQASPPRSSYHPGYYLHPKGYMVSKNYRGKNPKPRQYIHRSNNNPTYYDQPYQGPPNRTKQVYHGILQADQDKKAPPPKPYQRNQPYQACQQHETYPPQKPFPTYCY